MAANGTGNRDRAAANELLIAALAAGKTQADAAEVAGVSRRTVARRMLCEAFRQRVSAARAEMVARAMGKMSDGMAEAADVLRQLLAAESEAVRLGACRAMLELGCRLREQIEYADAIVAVEKALLPSKEKP